MDTQILLDQLRQRQALQSQATQLRQQQATYGAAMPDPQFSQTDPGYSGQIGGSRFQMPGQTNVNYGDIIGKGLSNYLSAKAGKDATSKEGQLNDLNNQFMVSTLGSDDQAQKLYLAAKSGLPGADKALADHIAPKKTSMAVLVQGLTSGSLSPEMAAQMAKEQGIDPEIVSRAATYASSQKQNEADSKQAGQISLQTLKGQQEQQRDDKKVGATGYTNPEFLALPPEQRQAAIQAAKGRESAESKELGKARADAKISLPALDDGIKNVQDMIGLANKATYLPLGLGLAPSLGNNGTNSMLRQGISDLVLSATGGKLGAGISNADVDFLKASMADLEHGNRDTAVAQLNKVLNKLQTKRKASADLVQGAPDAPSSAGVPTSQFDYTISKQGQAKQSRDASFQQMMKEISGGQ